MSQSCTGLLTARATAQVLRKQKELFLWHNPALSLWWRGFKPQPSPVH